MYGLCTSTGNVAFTSPVPSPLPGDLRGRAFAGVDLLWPSCRLLGLLGGCLLADAVGVRAVSAVGGTLLLAAAAVGAVVGCGGEEAGRTVTPVTVRASEPVGVVGGCSRTPRVPATDDPVREEAPCPRP